MNREEKMPGSILIVDDEQNLRHTLAFILKRAGYFVTTAENAEETLNTLQTGTFDLMILDIKMPDVDGLTLLKVIRQNHPKLPVFILTGYGSLDSAIQALHLEARDYLLKPIDPAQLLERIQKILLEEQSNQRQNEILDQVQSLIAELDEIKGQDSGISSHRPHIILSESARFLRRGVFYIDIKARYVEVAGQSIALPPSTFSYLLTLLRHSPDPVNYQDLVAESQGKSLPDTEARSLARWQIYQLRLAIEAVSEHPRFVITVRNFGYRLITENPVESEAIG
jgi:DNA-binding response OmpR family regulator